MAATTKFSLEGKALKLTTAADIEPHIKELKDNADVEEVVFVGNTLGIEACKALGDALKDKKKLSVSKKEEEKRISIGKLHAYG